MFSWTTLFSLWCAYLSEAGQIPHGKFCGTAMGLHINLSFKDSSHVDFNMTPDGRKVECPQEPFEFDQASGKIVLSSYNKARNQSDCLYLPFKRAADDPESVGFVYDASKNYIRFMMDTVTSLLSPATCGLDHISARHVQTSLGPSSMPSGEYCGSILSLARISVKVIDATHMDIDMKVFGTDLFCPREPYSFESSTGLITLTGVHSAKDCLKVGFEKQGQDASTVALTYNAHTDSFHVIVSGVGTDLMHSSCVKRATRFVKPTVQVAKQPLGVFCGTAMGLHMNITFTDVSHLDLNMTVNSEKVACPHEPYEIDASSGKIALTSFDKDRNQTDCLYFPFKRAADDPESVGFVYDSSQNAIHFMMDTVTSLLSPAMCGINHISEHNAQTSLRPSSVPSGEYCGSILSLARISVKVIDATHMDIDMKVFGTDLFCPREPYSFESSTGLITLTGVHSAKDCLKVGFEKQGQDASTVALTYNTGGDSFHVIVSGAGTDLTRASCAKKQELVFDATIVV